MTLYNTDSLKFISEILALETKQDSVAATALNGLNPDAIQILIKNHIQRDSNIIVFAPDIYGIETIAKESNKPYLKITSDTLLPHIDANCQSDRIFNDYQLVFFENNESFPSIKDDQIILNYHNYIINLIEKTKKTNKQSLIIMQEQFYCNAGLIKKVFEVHRHYNGVTFLSLLDKANQIDTPVIMANSNLKCMATL